MAVYGWKDIGLILVDGYNLQPGLVIDLNLPVNKAGIEQLHGAGNTWKTARATGTKFADGDVLLRMPYDDTDNYSVEVFRANAHVTDGVVCIGIRGTGAAAESIWAFKAHQLDYAHEPGADAITKLAANWTVNGQVYRPKIVRAYATATADGNTESASLDGGTQAAAVTITSSSVANPTVITTAAAHGLITGDVVLIAGHSGSTPSINGSHSVTVVTDTTFTIAVNVTVDGTGGTMTRTNSRSGGVAFLQVTDLSLGGHDGLAVTMRHSADNSTFATLGTFTTVTGARGAQALEITGNVNRYVAISWDYTGAGSPSGYIFVAFARG